MDGELHHQLMYKNCHVKFLFEASLGVGVLIFMNRKAQLILYFLPVKYHLKLIILENHPLFKF